MRKNVKTLFTRRVFLCYTTEVVNIHARRFPRDGAHKLMASGSEGKRSGAEEFNQKGEKT